jgi:hypothetical protein
MDIFSFILGAACMWASVGIYAWLETIYDCGFKPSYLMVLPVAIVLGPVALAINRETWIKKW